MYLCININRFRRAYIHVLQQIFTCTYTHAYIQVYIHRCIHQYKHAGISTFMQTAHIQTTRERPTDTRSSTLYVYTYIWMRWVKQISMMTRVHQLYTCILTHILCRCMCVRIYIHVWTYITSIRVYLHTYMLHVFIYT